MSIDLSDLLLYLDDTTIGSLLIKDFRIEQFVLKDGTLKLTDLDDLDGRMKSCTTDLDCIIGGSSINVSVPCRYRRCQNYSRMLNMYNLNKNFFDYSLNFDNPAWIAKDLKAIAKRITAFKIGLTDLWKELNRIAWNIRSGIYEEKFIDAGKPQFETKSLL